MARLTGLVVNDTGSLTLPNGTSAQRPEYTVTVQSFTTVGTTSWTAPTGVNSIEVLVVAGGGGGASRHGGGGGAGGLIYQSSYSVTPGSSYTVTVGGGGAGAIAGSSTIGSNGANSVFDTLTAIGGGYGSSDETGGGSGGSGGGGRGNSNTPGGSAIQGQGFPGGRGTTQSPIAGAGGGGAGGPGGPGGAGPGNGGNGLLFSITGSPIWYAGGGGGGGPGSPGGLGGGNGNLIEAVDSSTAGAPNTGGGGGAGGMDSVNYPGKNGGSGIVVVRYSISSENTDPSSQTRYNLNSNSIEIYGKTNRWTTAPTDQNLLNQGLILNFDASRYVSGTTWKDISGNNFDGSIVGSPTHSTANQGYFTLSSASQRVTIPNNSTLQEITTQVTINAWVYLNSYTDYDTIFWKANNGNSGPQASYGLSLTDGRQPRFTAANTECISTRPLQLNEWVNLIGVFDNGLLTLYVNGGIAAETTGPLTITTSAQEMTIGDRRFNNASIYPFSGRVAVCQLYNRALPDSEVKDIYQSYFSRFEIKSPIVDKTKIITRGLMMNIDAGNRSSISGINDSIVYETANGNHGNLVNGAIWQPDRRDRGSIYFAETSRAHISMRIPPSNSFRIDGEMTYEIWFRPTSYAGRSRFYLFDLRGDGDTLGGNSYFLYDLISGTTVRYTVLGGSATETLSSNISQPLNVWHHAAAVKTAQNWRIFLNGVKIADTNTAGGTPVTVNNNYRIATFAAAVTSSAEYYFAGNLAAARIYNVALSDSELIQNYQAFITRYGNYLTWQY